MDTATRVQILDKTAYILHSANILEKGMNSTILPSVTGKLKDKQGSLTLVWQLVLEKEHFEFKSVKFR